MEGESPRINSIYRALNPGVGWTGVLLGELLKPLLRASVRICERLFCQSVGYVP